MIRYKTALFAKMQQLGITDFLKAAEQSPTWSEEECIQLEQLNAQRDGFFTVTHRDGGWLLESPIKREFTMLIEQTQDKNVVTCHHYAANTDAVGIIEMYEIYVSYIEDGQVLAVFRG